MTAKRPPTPWSIEDESEAVAMYDDGRSVRDIAEWLGRPVSSVYALLHRRGLLPRPEPAAP